MSRLVLLDENLPQKLRLLLIGHTVVTTVYQGWAGKSNGSLLATAEEAGFDVFVTADQGINYQQNMNSRTDRAGSVEHQQKQSRPGKHGENSHIT